MNKYKIVVLEKGEWVDREVDADYFVFEDDCLKVCNKGEHRPHCFLAIRNEYWASVEELGEMK